MKRRIAVGICAVASATGAAGCLVGLGRVATAAPVTHDGPFGIYMGEPLAELHAVRIGPNLYQVAHPPKPNGDFPTVFVRAFQTTGVCQIMASTSVNTDDPTGERVRSDVDRIAGLLEPKYGPYTKTQDCNDSDDACERVWTLDKKQGLASYAYNWNASKVAKSEGIARITVLAEADSATSTEAGLGYDSSDEACIAAEKAAEGSGL